MMTLKNRVVLVAALFALTALPATAQRPRGMHHPPVERRTEGFDPGRMRVDAEKYIMTEAGLTPDEARRFFPLFHELKKQHRDIRGKLHRALERVERGQLADKDARRILAEIRRLKQQEARLDADAYSRFERILPPQKLLRVMRADRELRKKMFKNGRR